MKSSTRMTIPNSAAIAKTTPPTIAPTFGPLFTASIIVENN